MLLLRDSDPQTRKCKLGDACGDAEMRLCFGGWRTDARGTIEIDTYYRYILSSLCFLGVSFMNGLPKASHNARIVSELVQNQDTNYYQWILAARKQHAQISS